MQGRGREAKTEKYTKFRYARRLPDIELYRDVKNRYHETSTSDAWKNASFTTKLKGESPL